MDAARDIHALRRMLSALEPVDLAGPQSRIAVGDREVDAVLEGGLCRGALHEIVPAEEADAAAAAGFVVGLCRRALDTAKSARPGNALVWIRQSYGETEFGKLYPPGLVAMGLLPDGLVHLRLRDVESVLRAGAEALHCAALGAVVLETVKESPLLDLTATRKLALAAERSRVPLFLLRPLPRRETSVARTRWRVRAAASRPFAANAPGLAAFQIDLLRNKEGGREGLSWRLEWNHAEHAFTQAPLLRPVVSLPARRTSRPAGDHGWRDAG